MELLSLFLLFVPLFMTTATADDTETDYRLPKNIIPSHYALQLALDPENSTFTGFCAITITGTNVTTNTVELHASPNYITTKNYAFLDYTLTCNLTDTNDTTEIITFTCPEGSLDGTHIFMVEFTGELSTGDTNGVFRSSYYENDTQEVLVASHFEPVYARRAFPCFDEPDLKATFDLFVTRPDAYKVLANMPEEDSFYVGNGQLQTKFATTPRMSTYLVAFIVSKLEAITDVQTGNYTYRIYARSSVKDCLSVASTYGPILLKKLGDWAGISYEHLGVGQINQVVIPDVTVSTTENWGLIAYKEEDVLDEGDRTTQKAKQRIITTMAHQFARQWFGDYITPDWWSDTWLSEGFATYFQYYIPDQIEDENFELEQDFVVNVLQNILQKDGPSSSLLSNNASDIKSANDDISKFDDITYYKGASIVRMMKGMADIETDQNHFQDAMRTYLKKYRYNNTDTEEVLEEIMANWLSEFSMDFAIRTWIYQPGYPLLTAEYNHNMSYVQISQEPYSSDQNSTNITNSWYIPITYTCSDKKDFSITMKEILVPEYKNRIENIKNTSWCIFNIQHHGYYRVNYDDWLWGKIITALSTDSEREDIHVLNRAQLLDDMFNLGLIGRVSYQKVFDLAEYLQYETDYYPWVSGLNSLTILADKLDSNATTELLQSTIRRWWTSAMAKLKNESSNAIDPKKEAFFLENSCKLGLDDCINYTRKAFVDFKSTGILPDYNQRATIFCYGLRNSSDPIEDFYFLFDLYQSSTSINERSDAITGMGCSWNETVLSIYLNETISNSSALRIEDAAAAYRSMYMNGDPGLIAVLKFMFGYSPYIVAKYEGMRILTGILNGVGPKLRTKEQMNYLYLIIDYYSEIDDILICDWQLADLVAETKLFNQTYGAAIHNALLEKLPSKGFVTGPNCVFTVLSLLVFYLYR